ncbi:MAG TPA: class I SAM-dependent methyltransferase [Bordetella sp.]
MNKAEFDSFADEYRAMHAKNIAASGEGPDYFAEYKIKDIAQELIRRPEKQSERILDFGAGVGNSIPWIKKYLADSELTCADVSARSLGVAAERFPGAAKFTSFDGEHLPFPSGYFDLAYAMCVFHHIDHEMHVPLMEEISRTLSPGGVFVIFEHNPLNPLTVRAVNTCEFDVNARLITAWKMKRACLLAGFRKVEVRYRIFFPRMFAGLRGLEKYMTRLPLGAQYSVWAEK